MYKIIGAGMAGLLAGCMLGSEAAEILDASESVPNNHNALLRFRSSIVGDNLGIPFREVSVMKSLVSEHKNPVAHSLAYSVKTNGTATLRSVTTAEGKIEKRFISPPDLIDRMVKKLHPSTELKLGVKIQSLIPSDVPVISTMPMPSLAKALGYEAFSDDEFKSVAGGTIRIKLEKVDVCATLYFPDKLVSFYRASITDDTLIIEYALIDEEKEQHFAGIEKYPSHSKDEIVTALAAFGLPTDCHIGKPEIHRSRYAKILPIDDEKRKRFLMWATDNFNIYSLGRFATWRPSLMTDDLINDVRVIQKLSNKTDYDKRK